MTKYPVYLGAAAICAASAAMVAAPAAAQGGPQVSEVVVFGTDPCPRSTDDEIVVCARKPESERYRIPERLREGGSLQSRQAWAVRAQSLETVGATGINSCSAVGPGGFTGCLEKLIDDAFEERGEAVRRTEVAPPE